MKNKRRKYGKSIKIIDSFNHAVNGIISAVGTEKNMKIHYTVATVVLIMSLFFDFTRLEFLTLILTISLVLVAELLNTAIEKTVDLVTMDYNPIAKLAKDIAAGAVLVAAINSVIVGYLLFFDRLSEMGNIMIFKIRNSPIHLTVLAVLFVFIITIFLKLLFADKVSGTHFQGGAVSGHSMLAFCAATIISILAHNGIITMLSLLLALLVFESRIEGGIHTFWQALSGSIIGIGIGILIFQLMIR
ncbi:MAG: diacylglycerol kinase [Tissierellia bacterium]|nr:diacylglycerol kinase [Tissierellia bacterium]